MSAMSDTTRAGQEDCFNISSGNLSQRWLCCAQGHARLDIAASAVAITKTESPPRGMQTLLNAE